jgi:hypothetical protein
MASVQPRPIGAVAWSYVGEASRCPPGIAFISAEAGIYLSMEENARTLTTLTLFVVVCEQALHDLELCDRNSESLQLLLQATHDAASDFARTLDATGARARVLVTA